MKRFEQSVVAVAFAGAFSVLFTMACEVKPTAVGAGTGGVAGSTPAETGGGGAGGSGQGGASTAPIIVLPDAAIFHPDDGGDDVSGPASGDANCGSTQSKLEKKPADLLLVLDRSTSMERAMDSSRNCDPGSTTCAQRWATIISSIGKVLTDSPKDLNWGLKFFSSPAASGTPGTGGGNCSVATGVEVAVGPDTRDKIKSQIDTAGNASTTPTRAAIDEAVTYLKTVNDGNNKFILLATDGEPNCAAGQGSSSGSSDLSGATTAIENAAAAGFKVFVIGVGTETGTLTGFAKAGGTDKFYSALTPEELSTALSSIVGTVVAGCTYQLPSAPAAPNAVGVYVDKALLPQSDSDGWSYSPGSNTTININGSACDELKSGNKKLVEIFLPCKVEDVIPGVIP